MSEVDAGVRVRGKLLPGVGTSFVDAHSVFREIESRENRSPPNVATVSSIVAAGFSGASDSRSRTARTR
jgi:hypothetical protein